MPSSENDPLVRLERAASKLKDADDWDEPTGRTDVHVHLDSKPDSDRPSKPPRNLWGALRWALVAIGTGAALAIAQAVQSCQGK